MTEHTPEPAPHDGPLTTVQDTEGASTPADYLGALQAEQEAQAKADAVPDPVRDAREQLKLTEAEERAERVQAMEEAKQALADLEATVTQREWLLVTGALGVTRDRITEDGGLRLLALAWIREKREHGGASWDRLLNMTDTEILAVHGIVVTPEDAEALAAETAPAVVLPRD